MRRTLCTLVQLLAWVSTSCYAAEFDRIEHRYDGMWSVDLVCADTQDKKGLVKGYEYKFPVTIVGSKLRGQYGSKGSPASIVFSGAVESDGSLEIQAVGNTGLSDYSMGKVARGTDYSYGMSGRLELDKGQAERRELRPCTAVFAKM